MTVLFCGLAFPASAQQSNSFQISPAPIPYPYFESGRFDGQINGMGASISAPGMNLGVGGASGSLRYSFNDFLAWDFAGNFGLGNLTMPGLTNGGYQVPTHNSTLFTDMGGFSTNLEAQLGGKNGGLIFFGGFTYQGFSMSNSGTYYCESNGVGDIQGMGASMAGVQGGVQGNIHLGSSVRLAPFIMLQSLSGTSSMGIYTYNGAGGCSTTKSSQQIPTATSASYGLDILINDWSLGTFLQELKQNSGSSSNVHSVVFQVGYSFGNADELAKEKAEASLNGSESQNQGNGGNQMSARCQKIERWCEEMSSRGPKFAQRCKKMEISSNCQSSPAKQPSQDEFQAPKM